MNDKHLGNIIDIVRPLPDVPPVIKKRSITVRGERGFLRKKGQIL